MARDAVTPREVAIDVPGDERVSGLVCMPDGARACYVMAHGAGAGMRHPFLAGLAGDLAACAIGTLRYQFPYMEHGARRPDSPQRAQAAVRAAVAGAARLAPGLPLLAGGKSFGGRMTSQAQAAAPLPGVRGLVFVGFPLHPAGKPGTDRATHLAAVRVPMLFLQGARDTLADLSLLEPVVQQLGPGAVLRIFGDADHSFHVPARSGRTDADVRAEIARAVADWVDTLG